MVDQILDLGHNHSLSVGICIRVRSMGMYSRPLICIGMGGGVAHWNPNCRFVCLLLEVASNPDLVGEIVGSACPKVGL